MQYIVYNHGGHKHGVPISLIESQKIEFEDLVEIIKRQKERMDLYAILENSNDVVLRQIASKQATQLEYELQILWGFPTNFSIIDIGHNLDVNVLN